MKPEDCRTGRVVLSTQGRDKGRHFMIFSVLSADRVLVVDGQTHLVSRPKKKNIRHLKALPVTLEQLNEQLAENKLLQNHEVRQALYDSGYENPILLGEEECDIVQK